MADGCIYDEVQGKTVMKNYGGFLAADFLLRCGHTLLWYAFKQIFLSQSPNGTNTLTYAQHKVEYWISVTDVQENKEL